MQPRSGLMPLARACLGMLVMVALSAMALAAEPGEPSMFETHCAVCHGASLEGTVQGVALVGRDLSGGDSVEALTIAIADGKAERGMPAWRSVLDAQAIKSLALMIAERRAGGFFFGLGAEPPLPSNPVQTRWHAFSVEVVAEGLASSPFSIAVRPDGSILVTESMNGLRIVSPGGEVSDLVPGTPVTDLDDPVPEEERGPVSAGWLLDVALHPDYSENGWIYLHHTQRCSDCAGQANPLTSRNVLVRGRVRDGEWVNQETLWRAPAFDASVWGDAVAGGRIAFDLDGFVFITVGNRRLDRVQDLRTAYGKIHRLHDDGRIPEDNPFIGIPGALSTIWTFGHRSPQGLVYDARTHSAWNTEHGPRGGDELNRLRPGLNYGWPLYSDGQNYDGTEVAWGRAQSEIELAETEQAVKSWSPSIAVSNLAIYAGDAFEHWQGDFLVASLKASDLLRIRLEHGRVVDEEVLAEDLARIRDIDIDANGWIYLLLEHQTGGRIVRLKPAPPT